MTGNPEVILRTSCKVGFSVSSPGGTWAGQIAAILFWEACLIAVGFYRRPLQTNDPKRTGRAAPLQTSDMRDFLCSFAMMISSQLAPGILTELKSHSTPRA